MSSDIVLLHGALGSATQCAALAPPLAPLGRVHLPELEGHGATPPAGRALRIEHFAENVLRTLDAAGVATASFFGYSLGGYVALWLARHHPSRVARVMTLGTKLRWTPALAEREMTMLDISEMRVKVPRFVAQLEQLHGASRWESLVDETREMMRWMGRHAPLVPEDLRAITIPVRLAVGDRDSTVTLDECAEARALLTKGELEVLPATPHPFDRVRLPRLVQGLAEFLSA